MYCLFSTSPLLDHFVGRFSLFQVIVIVLSYVF